MRYLAAVWMPCFGAAIGSMFPDVVLWKSEGGLTEYEEVRFRIFASWLCSLRFRSHRFAVLYLILQQTATVETLSINQVCIGIFSITALAFIAGGMNAIYQIEWLPLMVAILIHDGILYVTYLGAYLLNDWLDWGVLPIIVFSAIFVVGYIVIWAIIYCIIKRNTAKLNKMLKQKQQDL